MAYQPNVIAEFNRALRDTRASPKVGKALFEAGIVESNLQNLNYGDRDSVGPLQQRPSQGWRNARNPYMAARDFIKQAQPLAGKYGTAGALAQAVQRSAFPGRYDQQGAAASAVLRGLPRAGALPQLQQASAPMRGGPDPRQQIALSLLGMGSLLGGSDYGGGDSLTNSLLAAVSAQQGQQASRTQGTPPSTSSYGSGVTHFDGKPVASWIAPILKQARATGLWKGNVTSGVRTKQQQLAAAKGFGLQHYGPGGPLASNHVLGHGGAVDVSDPQGLKRALAALHINRLKSAMANDPVHFSQTGY